jgi:hypothetical protein
MLGAHRFIGFRAGDLPCRLAPHLGVICSSTGGETDVAAVAAGRALQRVWLRATTFGLSFQVLAASALFAIKAHSSAPDDLRDKLAAGWKVLLPQSTPLVVFRMGRARPPSERAGRKTPRSVLDSDSATSEC